MTTPPPSGPIAAALPIIEKWAAIPGSDGMYDVSSLGRVRSWHQHMNRTVPYVMSLSPNLKTGYLRVTLTVNGRRQYANVHRLVTAAFLGPCPPDQEVRHMDGNKLNAALANLRYGTKSENQQDSIRHGTNVYLNRTECPAGHPYDERNTTVTRRGHRQCRACARIRMAARRPAGQMTLEEAS